MRQEVLHGERPEQAREEAQRSDLRMPELREDVPHFGRAAEARKNSQTLITLLLILK